MRASINDVAKCAGVSISTVSRIINGTARVDAKKEAAVRKAITELRYEPNQLGRGLAKQCTQMIGIYFYGGMSILDSTYNLEVLKGAQEVFAQNEYGLVLLSDRPDLQKPSFYRYVHESRIDALLVSGLSASIRQDPAFRELIDSDFPVSYIGKCFHENGRSVYAHFEEYHVTMVRALYARGHRKILIFYDEIHDHYMGQIQKRIYETYPDVKLRTIQLSRMNAQHREENLSEVICDGFTAACCPTIHDALHLIHSCARQQLSVPEQMSIVSVEHRPGEGCDSYPAISAVYVPAREMGRAAAEQILSSLRMEANERKHIEFQVEYTDRGSIAEMGTKV